MGDSFCCLKFSVWGPSLPPPVFIRIFINFYLDLNFLDSSRSLDLVGTLSDLGIPQSLVRDPWLIDYFLYEQGRKPARILDNLSSAYDFWDKDLKAPADILDIVKNGYRIPFLKEPNAMSFRNNKSCYDNKTFVDEAISDLLAAGLIKEVDKKPWVVSPLSVACHNGKNRLILDLSVMNNYVKSETFCLEDQDVFFEYCKEDNRQQT